MPLNLLDPDGTLKLFAQLIEEETGIVFQEHNLFQLRSRLEDFGKAEGTMSIEEQLKKFQNKLEANFRRKLTDLVTNNETLFFRDPLFYKSLKTVTKEFVLRTKPQEFCVWSAASSTGQEALSIAMALHELSEEIAFPKFKILGTDLSTRALEKAKLSIYSDFEAKRGLSDERRAKYFGKIGNEWQARSLIKDKVSFGFNNLLTNSVRDQFDVIFCRNVLIYLNIERKRSILQSLVRNLKPEGVLFLGVGETLLGVNNELEFISIEGVPVYRRPKMIMKNAA